MKTVELHPSRKFNGTEGEVFSSLFNRKIHLEAKRLDEGYTRKSAEFFANLPEEMIRTILKCTAEYVLALVDDYGEDFYPADEFDFDENTPCGRVLDYIEPVVLSVMDSKVFAVEDLVPAFRLTLAFTPIADENIEWTVTENGVLYVGEAANTSPWDKTTFKKGWNFV